MANQILFRFRTFYRIQQSHLHWWHTWSCMECHYHIKQYIQLAWACIRWHNRSIHWMFHRLVCRFQVEHWSLPHWWHSWSCMECHYHIKQHIQLAWACIRSHNRSIHWMFHRLVYRFQVEHWSLLLLFHLYTIGWHIFSSM